MKAIIYTRQSKHREESISHELQEDACRSFAKKKGWEVTEVLKEKGVSGRTIDKRKEFQSAVEMIKSGQAEVLLVWRWSRFARNTMDALITLEAIKAAGGIVECALESIDKTAMGKFNLQLILGMAELESNVKSEQWSSALKYRIDKGLTPSGAKQFGYDRYDAQGINLETSKGKTGSCASYVLNDDAAILQEAYKRYVAGEGARVISQDFTERKLNAPGSAGWNAGTFLDLLDKKFYAGLIEYRGQTFPGAHEPVVSEALNAKYRQERSLRATGAKPKNVPWIYTGLCVCGICGSPMVMNRSHKNRNLMCSNYSNKGKEACSGVSRLAKYVEERMAWWFGANISNLAGQVPQEGKKAELESEVDQTRKVMEDAQQEVVDLQLMAVRQKWSDSMVASAMKELQETLNAAQEAHNASLLAYQDHSDPTDAYEQIGAFLDQYDPESGGDVAPYRELVSRVVDRIIIHPKSTESARDPERDYMTEIEVVMKKV